MERKERSNRENSENVVEMVLRNGRFLLLVMVKHVLRCKESGLKRVLKIVV